MGHLVFRRGVGPGALDSISNSGRAMSSARSDADKITTIFMKHWAEFKKELSVAKELEHAEDKRLAWTMFLTGASMFLYTQTKQGKKREK